jgi:hypothetical protein
MTVREPGGVHFMEIEVSGIAAFESLPAPKPNACLERNIPDVLKRILPVSIPTKRNCCTQH